VNYRQALDLLNCRGNEVQGIHLGLHRITAILNVLGNPHARYPILHIAGTNGKGSVAAMAESMLRSMGRRTGLYTSPHLVRAEERIRVSGHDISPRSFANLTAKIREAEKRLMKRRLMDRALTYFEFLTACAFQHFADNKVDSAVVEVGLGGRLDATNVLTPRVSVITGVSYDHQKLLGNTLEEIAREKAGIIKRGVPVISGCRSPAASRVVRRKARRSSAPLLEIDRDVCARIIGGRGGRYAFDLRTPLREYRGIRLSLAGQHQIRNAALAVTALEAMLTAPLSTRAVRAGLARAAWPGRLDEYPAQRRTLLDGAHNLEGAQVLRDFLCMRKKEKIHLVFGALRDKDIRRIGSCLFPLAETIHLAPLDNTRAASPEEIASLHKRFRSGMRVYGSAREALSSAWRTCPRDGLVVVTGSLYLIGELLPAVRESIRG
jgi:dihydrofolate synthase/folylpolyglutamate synthase